MQLLPGPLVLAESGKSLPDPATIEQTMQPLSSSHINPLASARGTLAGNSPRLSCTFGSSHSKSQTLGGSILLLSKDYTAWDSSRALLRDLFQFFIPRNTRGKRSATCINIFTFRNLLPPLLLVYSQKESSSSSYIPLDNISL